MKKMGVIHALAWIVTSVVMTGTASAQVLNFTDQLPADLNQLDQSLLHTHPTMTFPAGSPIYAIVSLADANSTVGDYFGHSIRVSVSLGHQNGAGFDLIYSKDYPVQGSDATVTTSILPIFPDKPDPTFPGYDQLMRMLAEPHKDPRLVIQVRFESGDDRFHYWQNGFYYDTSAGLGRYAGWIKGAKEVGDSERALYEKGHIGPRTKAVHAYRAAREDAKVEADAKKWWRTHSPGLPLDGAKLCSDLIITYDRFRQPTEKQYCVLYTYKGNHKCWAQMRRLSYRRVGKDTYDHDVVDATYATMHIPVGDEQFDGAREYELSCK